MMEGINNVFKRINEIQNGGRNLGDSFKPEMVKEFENMYKNAISKNTKIEKNEEIHPYLKQKELEKSREIYSNEKTRKLLITQ